MQSTKTTILPSAYLGSIEYFAYLVQNNCIIECHDYFIKQSLRTRCEIYGPNGKQSLIVPKTRKGSSSSIIKDITINYDHSWQKEHWNSITSYYRSSPYFEYFEDEFENHFFVKHNFLIDLNSSLTQMMLDFLQCDQALNFSTSYIKNSEAIDLRKYNFNQIETPRYEQVFENKHKFIPKLSILDLLFNEGNFALEYLKQLKIK